MGELKTGLLENYGIGVDENDYFELWVTSSSNADVVTVDYLNWYTKQE